MKLSTKLGSEFLSSQCEMRNRMNFLVVIMKIGLKDYIHMLRICVQDTKMVPWYEYEMPQFIFLLIKKSTSCTIPPSVQFSRSVVSDSLRPHEWQHARPPCLSPTLRVFSNSCLLSQWCHPAISSSIVPFSSCPHPSQHQSLFQWVNSSHEVAKVLEFQL